ncbi:23S rRNA (guanine(745)-N(1))-methyltransferase [Vibrio porteresiae]|uniref:23S rRNA (Guanine(745)-N(1))-methyltransferase n=1 Tax=Vibrio porteresiae DSM 19223 TaxID=1123496 RepID=A0ABZ0QBU0_9VIBR|nr:23S rRNA (guanine(745)-N(1))-methyltransferase [Vibrio porteresiae]WPC73237.1 23S rRNA (guanine(745)-N(1))-methyltransferase [Vibrio porteresiae DSM 19223]
MAYQCPLCQLPLAQAQQAYVCANNHQFDVAKEGYVNLMPAHHKRSKDPGDNKEMTQARRRFLNAGHYDPMRNRVAELCSQYLKESGHQLLDIGCGEGYYTTFVAEALTQQYPEAQTFGLDISKVAVRYAAKRYPNCQFAVASSHRLPFADNSLDGVLRIYAPCKAEELARCVTANGVVITVTPAPHHLYQYKEHIYETVRLHDDKPEEIAGFQLVHSEQLRYTMALSSQDALDLLQMTPLAWHASDEFRQFLAQVDSFESEADFTLRVYQRAADEPQAAE